MPTIVNGIFQDNPVWDWRQYNRDWKEANKDAPPGKGIAIATTPPMVRKADGSPLLQSEATSEELDKYKQRPYATDEELDMYDLL